MLACASCQNDRQSAKLVFLNFTISQSEKIGRRELCESILLVIKYGADRVWWRVAWYKQKYHLKVL